MNKYKINFVCHGNICRSPMAQFIFLHLVNQAGVKDMFEVNSSATSSEEIFMGIGNPIYPPAQRELKNRGIPFEEHRATQLKNSDYQNYDLFVCMDSNNVRNAKYIFNGDSQNKVKKLLEYAGSSRDVADPWYSGDFSKAYSDIYLGCECLLKSLIKN